MCKTIAFTQNDTIQLQSYSEKTDSILKRRIFYHTNGQPITGKVVKIGNCYTELKDGIIAEKKCYGSNGNLLVWLYGNGETYQEECGDGTKRTWLNWQLYPTFSQDYDSKGSLKAEIRYRAIDQPDVETYYSGDNQLFRLEYNNEIPDFRGDTVFVRRPLNGLYFNNDSLYCIQNADIISYKYFVNNALRKFWSENKSVVFHPNGVLYQLKIYKKGINTFNHDEEKYFEYFEYNEQGKLQLQVQCSGNNIGSIEKYSNDSIIKLSYFLGQLQAGTKKEDFDGGFFFTTVSQREMPKRVKKTVTNGVVDKEELIPLNINLEDEEQYQIFLKTGNLISLDEYNTIRIKVFDL